jgi:hypothetical protein
MADFLELNGLKTRVDNRQCFIGNPVTCPGLVLDVNTACRILLAFITDGVTPVAIPTSCSGSFKAA